MDLLWTGTDVLFMQKYPGGRYNVKVFIFRILVAVLDRWFIERNYVIAEHLKKELHLTKPVLLYSPPMELKVYPKKEHYGFNILYYLPKKKNQKFTDWLYGADIIRDLMNARRFYFPYDVDWYRVDGTQDMADIYPIVDFYLRPNRHDGSPYMIKECEANNIPYYWSKENPDIIDAYEAIRGAYDNYSHRGG